MRRSRKVTLLPTPGTAGTSRSTDTDGRRRTRPRATRFVASPAEPPPSDRSFQANRGNGTEHRRTTMAKTVVGMFDSFEAASAALDELMANGIPEQDLGVIRPGDKSGRAPGKVAGKKDRGDKAGAGAAAGAGTGAIVGGAAGLVAGLAGVAIPGLGPMVAAGWLASTLAGAGIG